MKKYLILLVLISAIVLSFKSSTAASPSDYGLKEGDLISAIFSDDPDVYIINEHGYKRLFLNPEIFKFYAHLGGFANVKLVTSEVRDSFPTTGLFRNCEDKDQKVFGIDIEGEDQGQLHWVNTTGDQAVKDDPDFFKKVFCINKKEFNWYKKAGEFNSITEVPKYDRIIETATVSIKERLESKAETKNIGKVIICHYPLENINAYQTLTIDASALKAHLDHGDTVGACLSPTPTPTSTLTPTPTSLTTPTPTVTTSPSPTSSASYSPTPTPTATTTATPAPTTSSAPPPVSSTPTPTPTPTSPTYNVLFPIISSVLISSITSNSAVISWSTNVPAYGTFTYGPSVLNTLGPQDTTPITQHSFTISGLTTNTLYYFKVFSFNSYGYDSDFGGPGPQPVRTFTTLLISTPTPTPTPAPVGTITLSIDEQPTQKRVYVAYNSNKAVAVLYEYGTTTSYGKTSGWNNWGGTTPSSYFTDNGYYIGETYLGQYLVLNTTYHVRAKATTESGEIFYSNDYTFYLQEATPTPAPTLTPTPTVTASTSFNFNRDLYFGLVGNDVKQLQAFLISQVSYPANLITGYFGNITRDAVKRLQAKYGVNPASGYFGEITRRALNSLISN